MQIEQPTPTPDTSESTVVSASALRCKSPVVEGKLIGLYQNVVSLIGQALPKTIQIMSARAGEGSSTIAREFAKCVAGKLGKTVLLIDANRPQSQCRALGVEIAHDLQEVLASGRPISEAATRVGATPLYLSVLSKDDTLPPTIIESPEFEAMLKTLADSYDLVLIDAPAASEAAEGLALSPKVSGTILVIAAGETRWQVSNSVKERISKYGGRVLGVFLNKRRKYIPAAIYNRL